MYAAVRLLLVAIACCALTAQAVGGEPETLFAVAAAHYEAQRWEQAVDHFAQFGREYPDHPNNTRAKFFQSEALTQVGRHSEAYELYVEFLADEPSGPYAKPALFGAGETAFKCGRYDEARARLLQFQSRYPRDRLKAYVLMYLGELASWRSEFREAEALYRESLELYPEMPTADACRFGLIRILLEEKKDAAALPQLRDLAQRGQSPWAEMAILQLASEQGIAGKHQAALELYDTIAKRFPDSKLLAHAALGRGRALYELGRYKEAHDALSPIVDHEDIGNDARHWLTQVQQLQTAKIVEETTRQRADAFTHDDPAQPETKKPALPNAEAIAKLAKPKPPPAAAAPPPTKQTQPLVEVEKVEMRSMTREEQSRRRSAAIRRHAAEAMMRSGDYARAITMLEVGDTTGDDPESFANRYMLSLAQEGDKRNADSLATLNELNTALDKKLGVTPNAPVRGYIAPEDRTAMEALRDQVRLSLAGALVTQEKTEAAIAPLQAYLATPRSGQAGERAYSTLAICLARAGRAEDAAAVLRDLKANHPKSTLILPTTHQVADAAFSAQQWLLAADLFAELAVDGNPPELVAQSLAHAGISRQQAGDVAGAQKAFERFLDKFPSHKRAAEIALSRARALEQLGRDDDALAAYESAMNKYRHAKQFPQLVGAAARLHDRLGHDDQAIAMYQRQVREYPNSVDADAALYGLAWALRDLGQGAEADKVFRQLHFEHPKSRFWADATYRLAERASQVGDKENANKLLKALFTADCQATVMQHALYLQSQMAITDQRWSEAEAPLKRLVDEFPDGALGSAAQFWFAEVAYRSGDQDTASQRFDAIAAQTKKPDDKWAAIVPLRRAQLLAQREQWEEARKLAESITQDYPRFDQQYEVDYLIGRCLAQQGYFERARAAYQRVILSKAGGKTETAAMAQWMTGETHFQQENYASALREYLRVEVAYPYPQWQAAALMQAGKCHELLGQPKEAAELYAHLLKRHPQTEFTASATKRLEETKRR